MKKFIAVAMMALVTISTTAAFASSDAERDSAIGAKVIARNVVALNLVDKDAKKAIMHALQAGGRFGALECEAASGSDGCTMEILSDETLYQLNVFINEGEVKSAVLSLIAG